MGLRLSGGAGVRPRALHEADSVRLHGATGLVVDQPFFFPLRAFAALVDLPRETDPAGMIRLRTR